MKSLKMSENCKIYWMFFVFSLMSVVFVEFCYFYNVKDTVNWIFQNFYLFVVSALILMTPMVLLFTLFRNTALSIYIPTIISITYGIALHLKLIYRHLPLFPYEISMIFDLSELMKFLNTQQKIIIYVIIIVFILVFVLILKFSKRNVLTREFRITNIVISTYVFIMLFNYTKKNELFFIIVNLSFILYMLYVIYKSKYKMQFKLVLCLIVFVLVLPSYKGNTVNKIVFYKAKYYNGHVEFRNFARDGVIPSFLIYSNLDLIEKPRNYSKDEVSKIVAKYKEIELSENVKKISINDIKPNIIFVMSESLSDPRLIDNIKVNDNPLKNLDNLKSNNFSGVTIADSFGGGTNRSEFEALTGISCTSLNNNMFFTNIAIRLEFPSIVSMLKNEGYQSAAIHYNGPIFYNRDNGYKNLGFDHFYNSYELEAEYFDGNTAFVSDDANYKVINKILTENDKPTFIHNVTIQNHGPYTYELSNNQYEVEGLANVERKVEAKSYYKGIEHTDEQLQLFLNTLDQFPEPTIVVFWGDHLPNFYKNEDFGSDGLDKYRTPILIYSNFNNGTGSDIGEFSMNYISTNTFDVFNFKKSAYYYLIDELKNISNVLNTEYNSQYPSNLYAKYKNKEEIDAETEQILKDYEMILYDILQGENYSVEMNFFNIDK